MEFTDTILTAVKAVIETADSSSMAGLVTTTYPSPERTGSLKIVIDSHGGGGAHALNGVIGKDVWIRIWVIATKKAVVNAKIDIIETALLLTKSIFVVESSGFSPILPAFEDKDGIWQRNFDVKIRAFRTSLNMFNVGDPDEIPLFDDDVDGGTP